MKYSQFLQLNEIHDDISVDNIKNDELNEIVGILAGLSLLGLGAIFRKHILSWGVKKIYTNQLDKIAENFRSTVDQTVNKSIDSYRESLRKLKNLEGSPDEQKQLLDLQRNIVNIISKSIDRLSEIKNNEISDKIEKSTKLKKSAKSALKYYWETLVTDIKVKALSDLTTKNIITNKDLKDKIKKYAEKKKKDLETKEYNVKNNIRKIQQEEKQVKSKDYYEKKIEEITPELEKQTNDEGKKDVLNKIKDLLTTANNNLSNDEYQTLVDDIPEINGIEKSEIKSIEGLRQIEF